MLKIAYIAICLLIGTAHANEIGYFNNLYKENNLILNNVEIVHNKDIMEGKPILKSFFKKEQCFIEIQYPEEYKSIFFKEEKKDFLFLFNHELSHCILGQIFYKDIEWKGVGKEQQKKLNALIEYKTNKIIYEQQGEKIILPKVVFHEMFADVFASLYLYNKKVLDLEEIKKIISVREKDFIINNKHTAYLSFIPLNDIVEDIKDKKILTQELNVQELIELSSLYVEKSFINYILN